MRLQWINTSTGWGEANKERGAWKSQLAKPKAGSAKDQGLSLCPGRPPCRGQWQAICSTRPAWNRAGAQRRGRAEYQKEWIKMLFAEQWKMRILQAFLNCKERTECVSHCWTWFSRQDSELDFGELHYRVPTRFCSLILALFHIQLQNKSKEGWFPTHWKVLGQTSQAVSFLI